MTRRRRAAAVVLALAAPVFYRRWVLPRLLTWGATAEEVSGSYPGDELVPDAEGSSTMATTLPAPPEKVWPWLVQMGVGRAGWYSWDRLDNHGEPSADRIVPEWQSLEEGRRLNATPDGQTWFTVAVLRPGRTLVLRSDLDLKAGHSFEYRAGPLPRAYLAGVWGFHLRPAPGGGTRLVARTRGKGRPRAFTRAFDLVGQPAHFVMQTRQFRNLRRRVRASA